jgi:hypothetical protein
MHWLKHFEQFVALMPRSRDPAKGWPAVIK